MVVVVDFVLKYKIHKKNKLKYDDVIIRCKDIHNNKYDYSLITENDYNGLNTKYPIICKNHGIFYQSLHKHLYNKQGCPKCAKKYINTEEFIKQAKQIHGDKYIYTNTNINNTDEKGRVCIICPKHGEFWQTPTCHIVRKNGCKKCSIENKSIDNRLTNDEYLSKIKEKYGDKYDLSEVRYVNCKLHIYPICHQTNQSGIEHGKFKILPCNFYHYGCPKCTISNISNKEKSLLEYLLMFDKDVITNDRRILKGSEIDIYIPNKQLAIEFDGLYWHSEIKCKFNPLTYHLNKTNLCKEKGIRLIHIFEDEWIYKQEIVKSRLKSILGIKEKCIRASKCQIRDVDSRTAMQFLDENHLQGNVNSKFRYGLYYNDELVSLMTFGGLRKNLNGKAQEGAFELLRFANKLNTTVYGGASKLLKHFIKEVQPKSIISYADKRWSDGNLYKKLGFTHTHDSRPNYFYMIGHHRENRFKYRKSELIKKYGCPEEMSEHEFCLSQKWYRIYDCGTMVFEMKL